MSLPRISSKTCLVPERHPQEPEQCPAFIIALGSCYYGYIHSLDLINLVIVNFRKYQLFLDSKGIIPLPVESFRRNAFEVTDTGQGHVEQPVEKLVHLILAERHHATDRHPLTEFESGYRLLCLGYDGLLSGNESHFFHSGVNYLDVLYGFAQPHIYYYFFQFRDMHDVLVIKVLDQLGDDLFIVTLSQPCHLFLRTIYRKLRRISRRYELFSRLQLCLP